MKISFKNYHSVHASNVGKKHSVWQEKKCFYGHFFKNIVTSALKSYIVYKKIEFFSNFFLA